MFTGLVSDVGAVKAIDRRGELARIRIGCSYSAQSIKIGASIACAGPCLTAVTIGEDDGGTWFDVEAAAETLARTTVGAWRQGDRVNLERSLSIGDELGGHLVTGHVDGLAEITQRAEIDGAVRFDFRAPWSCAAFIAEKGSIALDGTSLTVNSVAGDAFSTLLIPHTLAVTTWGERRVGDKINLEVDLMARYAARLVEARRDIGLQTKA
jgi:riboflavin synthase